MSDIKCAKCGIDDDKKKCHLHHLIPKFMGGIDADGRRYLDKGHHTTLHLFIAYWLWSFVPPEKREEAKQEIKKRSLNWIER